MVSCGVLQAEACQWRCCRNPGCAPVADAIHRAMLIAQGSSAALRRTAVFSDRWLEGGYDEGLDK